MSTSTLAPSDMTTSTARTDRKTCGRADIAALASGRLSGADSAETGTEVDFRVCVLALLDSRMVVLAVLTHFGA